MSLIENLSLGEVKSTLVNQQLIHYLAKGSGWRFDTLLEKEPETIAWINSFQPGETLWDIGANVGIYTIYAAKKGIRVLAFEPHFANYFQLCINVMLNNLQDRVMPLCLAFAHEKSVDTINLASVDFGTSMSSFGSNLDFRGNPYQPVFRQGMVGYDIDSFILDFKLQAPNHFKIDVDGIELEIIKGGSNTFANPAVRSVSIELIDSDHEQVMGVTRILNRGNLYFAHKKQNAAFATPETKDVMNYLYQRMA